MSSTQLTPAEFEEYVESSDSEDDTDMEDDEHDAQLKGAWCICGKSMLNVLMCAREYVRAFVMKTNI